MKKLKCILGIFALSLLAKPSVFGQEAQWRYRVEYRLNAAVQPLFSYAAQAPKNAVITQVKAGPLALPHVYAAERQTLPYRLHHDGETIVVECVALALPSPMAFAEK